MDIEVQQFCDDLLESVRQMNANERASETTVVTTPKISATIEFDRDIFEKFRQTGGDFNFVLKQWLQAHSLA
jgi:uncharacterized protein (DUF4415 family)